MGGLTPSVSRKLSKPRTKTASPDLTYSEQSDLAVSSPIRSSTDMDYFGDHAIVMNSQGERRSRRKSRTKLRAYLYGSSNESSQTLDSYDDDDEHQSGIASAARGARMRISRTGSSIMLLSSAMASTTYLSNESTSRLQPSPDPEDTARIAEQIKEKAAHDSLAAMNHVSSPVDEDKHVDSVLAPLRRKSLYTPGIATRHPSDILRKPPPPQSIESKADRDYYYNPAYSESSPLARLAALANPDDGRSTPSDLHITHLGGLQLGTLRVTNGTDSPVPHEQIVPCRRSTTEPGTSKDHQTAFKDLDEEISPNHREPGPIQAETKSNCERVNTLSAHFLRSQHQRSGSEAMAHEYISEISASPFAHSDDVSSTDAVIKDSPSEDEAVDIFDAPKGATDTWRSSISDTDFRHALGTTRDDAFQRLNGATPSVSESHRLSVPLSLSSRYSNLIGQAPKTDSGYCSNASVGSGSKIAACEDPEDSQNRHMHDQWQKPMSESARCVSGPREVPYAKSKAQPEPFRIIPPPPIQRSFTSIPSPASALSGNETENTVRMNSVMPCAPEDSLRPSSRSLSQNFTRKLQKRPKSQPPPANLITVQGYRELTQVHIPRVPSLIAARHAERLRSFPALEHTFPSAQHVTARQSPIPKKSNVVSVRFPSPANALEAAAVGLAEESVTPTRNRRSMSRPRSIFRRNTAEVDDTEWGSSDLVRSPSWSDFGAGKKKRQQRKLEKADKEAQKRLIKEEQTLTKRLEKNRRQHEKQIKKEDDRSKTSRSRASSRTRGRSSERPLSQYEVPAGVADFGTVIESLGGSPYDIATSMIPFPSAVRDANNKHPHQMSNSRPRATSMTGGEEVASYGYDRARSRPADSASNTGEGLPLRKIRPQTMFVDAPPVPAISAVDLKTHDVQWMRGRQKSLSIVGPFVSQYTAPKDEVNCRPQSAFVDAPPVPTLPSSSELQQREAQISGSRPQSMIINTRDLSTSSHSRQSEKSGCLDPEASSPRSRSSTPRKGRASNKAVPNLWSNGSLEKKAPKTGTEAKLDASKSDINLGDEASSSEERMWAAQKQAWSQRRKSAGEALLLKNQLKEVLANSPDQHAPSSEQGFRPHLLHRAHTACPERSSILKTEIAPLTSYPDAGPDEFCDYEDTLHQVALPEPSNFRDPESQSNLQSCAPSQNRIPRKRVGSGTSTPKSRPVSGVSTPFERLVGRFEGGLSYGYEPGHGLGGSAGTRSAKTAASRKSMEVSRGYGIDLSDIPVFVAPTQR